MDHPVVLNIYLLIFQNIQKIISWLWQVHTTDYERFTYRTRGTHLPVRNHLAIVMPQHRQQSEKTLPSRRRPDMKTRNGRSWEKTKRRLNKAEIKKQVSKKLYNFAISLQALIRKRSTPHQKPYGDCSERFLTHCWQGNKTIKVI